MLKIRTQFLSHLCNRGLKKFVLMKIFSVFQCEDREKLMALSHDSPSECQMITATKAESLICKDHKSRLVNESRLVKEKNLVTNDKEATDISGTKILFPREPRKIIGQSIKKRKAAQPTSMAEKSRTKKMSTVPATLEAITCF